MQPQGTLKAILEGLSLYWHWKTKLISYKKKAKLLKYPLIYGKHSALWLFSHC